MNYAEYKREKNRIAQEKYRNSTKGQEYYKKYREEHKEEYNAYMRAYHKKRMQECLDANNK